MKNIAYALSAAIAAGAILPLTARDITSLSVDSGAGTATVQFDAGEEGDGHVLYYAWSNDGADKGESISSWPNVARIRRVADDATSLTFALPAAAGALYAARAFLATSSSEYDYLIGSVKTGGTSGGYIDTGVRPNKTTAAVVDGQFHAKTASTTLFGVASSTQNNNLFCFSVYISGGIKFASALVDKKADWISSSMDADTSRHVFHLDANTAELKIYTDGDLVETSTHTGSITMQSSTGSILLFARRNGVASTIDQKSNSTIYSCVISNGSERVRYYRPAVYGGTIGMYDFENRKFYGSATGTALQSDDSSTIVYADESYAVETGDEMVAVSQSYTAVNTDFTTDVPYVESNSITVSGGGTKSGPAPLTLAGNNTWGGAFTVNEGTLVADFGQGLATTDSVVLNGGTYSPYLSNLFTGTLGGASGAGLVSIASGAREAGFSAYGHPLTVRLGNDSASTLMATGATYTLTKLILNDSYATDTLTIDGNIDFGAATATNEVGAATAVVKGNVNAAGGMVIDGAGTLVLNGLTNEFATLSLASGSTTVVAPTADGVTNALSLARLLSYGNLVVSNCETTISAASDVDSCVMTSGGSSLSFVGGKLTVTGGKYFRFANNSSGSATLIFDGVAASISPSDALFTGYNNCNGTVVVTNDAFVSTRAVWGRRGAWKQYGGNVSIWGGGQESFALGYDLNNVVQDYYLYGGTLDKSAANDYYARIGGSNNSIYNSYTSTGRLFVHGGEAIFRCRYCTLGTGTKHTGVVEVKNGGTFTMTHANSEMAVGNRGDGTFEVSDGGVATINGSVIALAASAGGRTANVSILTNGTLKAQRLVSNANANEDDTAILVLDGGKMIANTSAAAEFMHGFTSASVGIGGVVIDTAGQDLTIGQSFSARDGQSAPVASTAADLAALAAFTKAGEGTLSLTGDNDWLCATCVSNGTLVVGADALPAATTLQLRGGAIDLGGNSLTVANLVGFGVVSNGTLTVTGAVWPGVYESGTLKIDSTATLNMTRVGCSVASDGTCGCLETAGTLNLSGVTVVGENMENKKRGGLTLARAAAFTGSPVGDPSLAGNAVSVSGGALCIGEPGFFLIFK